MAQPDGKQAFILTILRLQVLYLVLVIANPRRSCCSACPVLQRKKHFVRCEKATLIGLSPEINQQNQYFELITDCLNNVEGEYRDIRRTLPNAAAKNHVISGHSYHFLPEGSDKLCCHAGVIQVTLSLTHDNS